MCLSCSFVKRFDWIRLDWMRFNSIRLDVFFLCLSRYDLSSLSLSLQMLVVLRLSLSLLLTIDGLEMQSVPRNSRLLGLAGKRREHDVNDWKRLLFIFHSFFFSSLFLNITGIGLFHLCFRDFALVKFRGYFEIPKLL